MRPRRLNVDIYLRKSRKDIEREQTEGVDTLQRHRSNLLTLVKKEEHNIVNMYEEVVSGESITGRPQMQELLKHVEEGSVDAVVIMDLDRLGRGDMLDQGIIDRAFRYSSTLIITPTEVYDPESEEWEIVFGVKSLLARGELKAITRRMQGGRKNSAKEGKSISKKPPYGYLRDENLFLYPDSNKDWVVKKIFNSISNGLGRQAVAHELDKLGIEPPNTNRANWSPSMITAIIKNEVYVGTIVWGKFKYTKRHGEYTKRRTGPEEWIIKENAHDPIVTKELWDKANYSHSARHRPPSVNIEKKLSNPLAGVLFCSLCGRSMLNIPRKNRRSSMLRCANPGCLEQKSSYLDIVEERIIWSLEYLINEYEMNSSPEEENDDIIPMKIKAIEKKEKDLEQLYLQKNNLHDLLEKKVYDIATFLDRQNVILERIDKLETEINSLKDEIKLEEDRNRNIHVLIPAIRKVLEVYKRTKNVENKNYLLKSILDKATYLRKKEWKNQDEFEIRLYPKI